jgi:hypothetical protein
MIELRLEHHTPGQQEQEQEQEQAQPPPPAKSGRGRPRKSATPAATPAPVHEPPISSSSGWSQTYLVTDHVVSRLGMQRAGKEVQRTVVSVAFPVGAPTALPGSLSGNGGGAVPEAAPPGRVYAFLPIHSNYELPFELQVGLACLGPAALT